LKSWVGERISLKVWVTEVVAILALFYLAYLLRSLISIPHTLRGDGLYWDLSALTVAYVVTLVAPMVCARWVYNIEIGRDRNSRRTGLLILILSLVAFPYSWLLLTETVPVASAYLGLRFEWGTLALIDSVLLFLLSLYGLHRTEALSSLFKSRVRKLHIGNDNYVS